MILLIISFLAWILTILAPCVLPLLPIILAWSLDDNNKKWPYVIIASLAISMILFSILLKASTLFITVPQSFWSMFSGGLIIWLWIITLFPNIWQTLSIKLGFEGKSTKALHISTQKQWYKKNILTWFALWPVFTSCSPTYALILAIILPAWFGYGLINLIMYALWLSVMLLLIAIFWQKIVKKLKIVANPKWYFKKVLAIIFIIIWLSIFTWVDKKVETYLIWSGYFIDLSEFENGLIKNVEIDKKVINLNTNDKIMENTNLKEAYFAWGCFWCMEWIFEAQEWVKEAIVWYAWGTEEDAIYDKVSLWNTKHRESVKVVYDPNKISYDKLVELFWTQIDPTDPNWQFADKWYQYTTAIIYSNDEEKEVDEKSKKALQESKRFDKDIATQIVPFTTFYPAEEYHQDYYKKSSFRYNLYKKWSGRADFIEKHKIETGTYQDILKKKLTPLQYKVTQEAWTEKPFDNEYWDNHEDGIYVDVVDWIPLFLSKDKYASWTGWPSFTKPIDQSMVNEEVDDSLFSTRTEIKSKNSDSHLWHVFNDGPADKWGLRYCMNSAALKFIPLSEMKEKGYDKYLWLFEL